MAVYTEAARPRPWGFWATTGWAFLSFIAAVLIAIGCAAVWRSLHPGQSLIEALSGSLLLVCTAAAAPVQIGLLALAARLRRWQAGEYLGLMWLQGRWLGLGVVCLAVVLPTLDLLTYLIGQPIASPFQIEAYASARAAGLLPLLWVTFGVIAPAVEEITFRGFLYRGWAASRLGILGAILLTSALWSMLHIQYDWIIIGQIFCIGLMLGCFRWLSGSTSLTIVMHALMNLWGTLETLVTMEWFS
jgi:membrane protease YdiL (CAAX protease family)